MSPHLSLRKGRAAWPRYRESSREPLFVIEQGGMIDRGTFQIACAAAANAEQLCCFGCLFPRAAHASETLLQCDGDSASHALAGFACQSPCKLVSFGIFDVEAHLFHLSRHDSTTLPEHSGWLLTVTTS